MKLSIVCASFALAISLAAPPAAARGAKRPSVIVLPEQIIVAPKPDPRAAGAAAGQERSSARSRARREIHRAVRLPNGSVLYPIGEQPVST